MSKSERMDYGGLDFVVRKLELGAAKPGQAGTAVLEGDTLTGDIEIDGDLTVGSGVVIEETAAVASAGANADITHVLPIKVGSTTYYILLSDDNSS